QVVASELHGEQPQAVPGRQGAGTALENHFAVIPADRTWRPQPLLKPLVDGPQSAVVTGPAGEEIFCDEHGRVRVKFNWDRYNPADQDSSCWIRVAQAWAGTGFGHLAIPRVGQEVIVDFLNGDPDQPIIMGRTYHQENRTPGSLPGTKTQMTIRSKTYMGSGFNELKFDDATGREQVYIHAQKNMDTEVLNDRTTTVKHDHRETVKNDQTVTIQEGNRLLTVEKGHKITGVLKGSLSEDVFQDSRDQLTGYCSAQGEQWEYRHDASGRRTEKRCDRKKIRFTYLWDGDSIGEIREYRDDKLYSVRHLVFNSFELISQQFSRVRQPHPSVAPQWVTRTNHAVNDLTGRPLMLFNSEGKTVWRPGQTSLWGLALSLPADTGYPDPRGELDPEADPGLLYAGQWRDGESGLCYNRFRYYEPESGMYLVSDPLGLQGGEQTYRYVPNPLRWIDPLGLNKGASLSKMMNSSSDLMGLRRQPQNFWRLYRGKDI
ncbi:type VI secretion system tip protein TssI/VgrG, partial [Escherichia coli]|uniref:type VI secretion system tip protein TssI/VgrG n=1 Tax=Escherichia coli TaxID=562 RepID=UPI00201981F4